MENNKKKPIVSAVRKCTKKVYTYKTHIKKKTQKFNKMKPKKKAISMN